MSLQEQNSIASRDYDLWSSAGDYPVWGGRPKRTLIICTQHRSGSSLLGEAIHFAGLGCPVEYFHGGVRPLFEKRWKTTSFQSYLDALYRLRTTPAGTFAAKIVWFDVVELVRALSPGEFDTLQPDGPADMPPEIYRRIYTVLSGVLPNPVWVHLTRRDEIAQAVSHFIAWQTQTWRQFTDVRSGADALPQPAYDFDEICQTLARIQRVNLHWENFFRANALLPLRIAYEDMAQDYDATLRRLFTDIGKPDAPVTPPRLKRQADAYSETLLQQFLDEFHRRARGG